MLGNKPISFETHLVVSHSQDFHKSAAGRQTKARVLDVARNLQANAFTR